MPGCASPMDLIARISILVLLLVTPWPLGSRLPWAATASTGLILFVFGIWLAKHVWQGKRTVWGRSLVPVAAFLGLGIVQATTGHSVYPFGTWLEVGELAGYAAVMALSATLLAQPAWQRRVLGVLCLSVSVVAAFSLIQYFTWNGMLFWSYESPFGGTSPFGPFNNRNYFAGYTAAASGPCVAVALSSATLRWRVACGAGAGVGIGAVAVSMSRAGILAMAVCVVVAAGLSTQRSTMRRSSRRTSTRTAVVVLVILGVAATAVLAAGVGPPLLDRFQALATPDFDRSAIGRLAIWSDTLEMIKARPLVGFGLDTFVWAHLRFRTNGDGFPQHAHSEYLETLAEAGAIGGALAVWFLIAVSIQGFQAVRTPSRSLRVALVRGALASWAAILVLSLIDFPTVIPATNYVLAVLAGTILGSGSDSVHE